MKNLILMAAFVAVMVATVFNMVRDVPAETAPAQPTQVMVEVQQTEPTTQVVEVQPTTQVVASGSYWSLSANKAFKAIEYGCTLGWKSVGMSTGCVIVIDRTQKGYGHNGITAPFGVVIPSDMGVTITYGWDGRVFVSSKPKTFTFVVIDDKDARVVQSFTPNESLWDDELLREFFLAQMGGDLDSIWREGVSDEID